MKKVINSYNFIIGLPIINIALFFLVDIFFVSLFSYQTYIHFTPVWDNYLSFIIRDLTIIILLINEWGNYINEKGVITLKSYKFLIKLPSLIILSLLEIVSILTYLNYIQNLNNNNPNAGWEGFGLILSHIGLFIIISIGIFLTHLIRNKDQYQSEKLVE